MGAATLSHLGTTERATFFDPERYIINVIRRAVANKQNVKISLKGVGDILLLSERGEYISSTNKLDEFCKVDIEQLQVAVVDDKDPELQKYQSVTGRNIDELLWRAAYCASNGRLMKGCAQDDVVQLRHWPNVTRIPVTPNTMRIASLLTRHPTSLVLARHLLKVDTAELSQFYSAARCAGIAHVLNRQPKEPIMKPHRNRALLGMLLNKIAGL